MTRQKQNGNAHCTSEKKQFIPFSGHNVKALTLFYTHKCNVTCEHCCFACGPEKEGCLGLDDARRCISGAAEAGLEAVRFSGGECLLFHDDVCQLMKNANQHGLETLLATNCFWAGTDETTKRTLEDLTHSGLDALMVSADSFHQQSIPIDNVLRVLEQCGKIGLSAQVEMRSSGVRDPEGINILKAVRGATQNIMISRVRPYGRFQRLRYRLPHGPREIFDVCRNVFVLSVSPSGNVFACSSEAIGTISVGDCPGNLLHLGSIRRGSMKEIIDLAENSAVTNTLRVAGPNGLLDLWPDNKVQGSIPERFCDTCDFCMFLLGSFASAAPDLLMRHATEGERSRIMQSWSERTRLFPEP